MASWSTNPDDETEADVIDQVVEAVIVVLIAVLCIGALAWVRF